MVRLAAKILSCKQLGNMRHIECTTRAIEIMEQCAVGVIFNWSQYLLNELIDDAKQAQVEDKAKFHYSWLLILISFSLWSDPPDY